MATQYTQASAGSGKTYSIQRKVADMLISGTVKPAELIVVTFTVKAAEELKTRIAAELIQCDRYDLAVNLADAHIGTIHGVCGSFLKDFAFELGLSPQQRVLDGDDKNQLIKEALDACLKPEETKTLNQLARRLSIKSWQEDVLKLIESARLNDIGSDQLNNFSASSRDSVISLLPEADTNINEAGLLDLVQVALENCQTFTKPTKGLQDSISTMEQLQRNSILAWQDWVKLSKLKAGVKEKQVLEPVINFASQVLICQSFQTDMQDMIACVFNAANKVMSGFASIKAERGLVDFVDQEHLFLNALSKPDIATLFQQQIKYLIVDEFQDTNPIQLALFFKLASYSDHILFVGDVKQAIYEFRGSDAQLSLSVIRHIQSVGEVDTLENSWRSRPGLVYFNNALFTEPFSHLLQANEVVLTPARDYTLPTPEIAAWTLNGGNQSRQSNALAMGIRSLIESDFSV